MHVYIFTHAILVMVCLVLNGKGMNPIWVCKWSDQIRYEYGIKT